MTLHHRSRIHSVIDYSDYFKINESIGCCCKLQEIDGYTTLVPVDSTFSACDATNSYFYLAPTGMTCGDVGCQQPGITGCCCSCKYLTPAERVQIDENIIGSTAGMVDGVSQCDCENIGGKWVRGPCNRSQPFTNCRKSNGVDVRLPKACCGVTLGEITGVDGNTYQGPIPYCQDVCSAKECSDNVVLNYVAKYYNNGRRCFFTNNAGAPVSGTCQVETGNQNGTPLVPPPPEQDTTLPICNNSNFFCWGNGCSKYVNLINNGFYTSPSVNDYAIVTKSGGASKLQNFNEIIEDTKVVGDGLFSPFTGNYLQIRSRYNRAAFITQDNKVIFSGSPLEGVVNGSAFGPQNYDRPPFYKYDRVDIGKNFAILHKTSNIGPRADFIGYLTPGNSISPDELNFSGVQTVHALEEAACITRLNFETNNIELWCKGYPFNTSTLSRIDGGFINGFHYTIDPDSVSCNGFHCTYEIYKLDQNRELIERYWKTSGEYKRTKNPDGSVINIPFGRLNSFLPDQSDFEEGIVVAGYNFDCFMQAVSQNPQTDDGYTRLSCYGIWDPSDTNKNLANIKDHTFGNKAMIPYSNGLYSDCDYHKCFAVMPEIDYCDTNNSSGFCCLQNTCQCNSNITQQECDDLNGTYYNPEDQVSCFQCLTNCGNYLQCGLTLSQNGDGPHIAWFDVDASELQEKSDSMGRYIEFKLFYITYGIKDRIIILSKTWNDDTNINQILKKPISLVYGANGGPRSNNYNLYTPFNTPVQSGNLGSTGPHPYYGNPSESPIQAPTEGFIADSGCVSSVRSYVNLTPINETHPDASIKIYENQMSFNPTDPDYKTFRVVVFGGCDSSQPTEDTVWNLYFDCDV